MEELLSPVSRTYLKSEDTGKTLIQETKTNSQKATSTPNSKLSSFDDVIDVLRNEPDYDALISALRYLFKAVGGGGHFMSGASGPQTARVIQILVTEIVPNYWTLLKESSTENETSDVAFLLDSLRSLAGLNAILLRLRTLTQEQKSETADVKRSDIVLNLNILLELLCELLDGSDRTSQLWTSTSANSDSMKKRILSREFVNVIGGGRIVSLSAEADALVPQEAKGKIIWIADGVEYSKWLARNVVSWSKRASSPEEMKLAADLLSKAMHLGYSDSVIRHMLGDLINEAQLGQHVRSLFDNLAHMEQRNVLFGLLKTIAELHLNKLEGDDEASDRTSISAAASVINGLVANEAKYMSHLVTWLTNATGAGVGDGIGIRRAVLAVLASDGDNILTVLEKSLNQFGDFLYIKHTPMLQQEVHAQVLLLSAGYVQRRASFKLSLLVRSGAFMNMVSKRLEASQTRARLLGMIVGETLSQLAHKDDKKLNFNMEETKSEEAIWYKSLVDVSDVIGPVDPLATSHKPAQTDQQKGPKPPQKRRPAPKPAPSVNKAKAIIEVIDSDEEEEDDIIPMTKPDEDDEDSGDEDPETVRRDKPKAPVYIRNLVAYFRDTENYDRQKLALTTAPTLIRRKANFGTEVKEHAEDLASLLLGLQDQYEIDNFHDLRLQSMIAIVVAQPQIMGQWFAKTFFNGDYSIAQRASVLTVLGLSARELAGFAYSEYASAASFPSQTLPDRMKKLYVEEATSSNQLPSSSSLKALPSSALDTISKSLTSDFMAPLAANAADSASGPDALKLSTFKSRLEQQQSTSGQQKSKAKPRVRAIPNTTAQLIATSFFFPLTARFQSAMRSTGGRTRGIIFQPFLLSLYMKTLALLLHAAGPSTLALPDMTSELWDLLLGSSVRAQAVGDLGVTHAVLFALLTMLEVNENRMRDICQSMPREVVETQEWVAQIFGDIRGGDGGGEENDVRMLAAGVLIRIREGMEKYRALLMGEMIG
ncbi:DNA replication checkpoint protein tel2 [Cytospora mali]|uniref:DNA replication checkpoint protein tel2 n=1 Tax=Cytospora mali TaxID=578113 RepID=A0A194V137_CYTMA|nr:DNA replication checkpoint protein tel2 [Valsa mali var. pyri (nom. inval.)]